MENLRETFEGKKILVTGGCGSVGSEIVKQLLKYNPEVIRVFDTNEDGHFRLGQQVKDIRIRHLIGDIRDRKRVERAMENIDIVFHAAALKHVPFCEYNPFEAVHTNVFGTKNLIDAAIKEKVDRFIGISTDKAVDPINTMGATKLLSEKIITSAPIGKRDIKFCCVRFGNVLNSSGSVIPIFKKQIKEGNEVTITHPEMTRFFMELPDAINLVLKAARIVKGGEVFILKMNALKITDLAKALVDELAPRHNKDPSTFTFKHIGVRPGEKMHESLITKEELLHADETQDMIILRNSLLAQDNRGDTTMWKKPTSPLNSAHAEYLSQEDIKKILREKNILNE